MKDICFFFHIEDGILVTKESRELGDVYMRQHLPEEFAWR